MKIIRIETIPVRVPIKPALAIRGGRGLSHSVSPFLLVKIHTDEGIVGVGEASCTARWSGEDQVTAAHFVAHYFAPQLVGETLDSIERLNAKFAAAVAGNFFTKSAVEMALWDIVGQAQGKTVWEIAASKDSHSLSLASRFLPTSVPTKWSVSGVEPSKAAQIAKWAVAQGFAKMKVKVGIDPREDVARVRAVREAIGPAIKLGVDAN